MKRAPKMHPLNTRSLTVQVLVKTLDHHENFNPALIHTFAPTLSREDQAFVSHLCFGVLRYYFLLNACLQRLMPKPLKPKDRDLQLLLLLGLFQIFYLDTPDYAILHPTVEAVPTKKKWAKALLNGIFREALRQKDVLKNVLSSRKIAHPLWLKDRLQNAWPNDWEAIIAANLIPPPFTLRINSQKINRENYIQQLDPTIKAEKIPFCENGFILSPAQDVTNLAGFDKGWISVQDGAAQLAASLLDLQQNLRICDACAAPGGKTAHILEIAPKGCEVWALDKDPHRLERVRDTLQRLELEAKVLCADAANTQDWWDEQPFDRILLDAPCSATGVIRRHPDILHHRQPEQIQDLIAEQQRLLTKMWPLLKQGGILIYATCSILPDENVEQMEWFLKHHPDAKEDLITASWGLEQRVGRQILPGQHNMDGFYYARLRKIR